MTHGTFDRTQVCEDALADMFSWIDSDGEVLNLLLVYEFSCDFSRLQCLMPQTPHKRDENFFTNKLLWREVSNFSL